MREKTNFEVRGKLKGSKGREKAKLKRDWEEKWKMTEKENIEELGKIWKWGKDKKTKNRKRWKWRKLKWEE